MSNEKRVDEYASKGLLRTEAKATAVEMKWDNDVVLILLITKCKMQTQLRNAGRPFCTFTTPQYVLRNFCIPCARQMSRTLSSGPNAL
jgi:hypothetical protein